MKSEVGDKQTDFGIMPLDWEVRQLSEHFKIYPGGDVPKLSLSQIQSKSHPYPIYANSLQRAGLYGYTGVRRSPAGCLTITGRGYLGHAEYRDEPFFPIVRLLVLEPIGDLDPRFTTYSINDRVKFAFESTGVPQLTAPQLGKYSIASPSLSEQRIISSALSDVDALLGALDQIIVKKRLIKQGAMQDLLTARCRIPGFSGKWNNIRLSEHGKFLSGSGFPLSCQGNKSGDLPFFKVSDFSGADNASVLTRANHYIDQIAQRKIGARIFPPRAIAFAKIGAAIFLERKRMVAQASCLDNNMAAFVLEDENLSADLILAKFQGFSLGALVSSTALPAISSSDLKNIEFYLPESLQEQQAISALLNDMNAEIQALEQRRTKTAALKQGMMQELLTGRTRLV